MAGLCGTVSSVDFCTGAEGFFTGAEGFCTCGGVYTMVHPSTQLVMYRGLVMLWMQVQEASDIAGGERRVFRRD
jgi:hypothetical protein